MIEKMSREAVQKLKAYTAEKRTEDPDIALLSANENPYPLTYALRQDTFNRYPEPQPKQLIEAYAAYAGVAIENILVSRGGDEAIDLLIKAFCEPGLERVLYAPPTFGMYQVNCDLLGVETLKVSLNSDFSLNTPAIIAAIPRVKLAFICSPNNPTGNQMQREEMIQILEAARGRAIVVVDEAYIEFASSGSLSAMINDYPHLAIVRTLSKAFGLAGIRCGFTLASVALINVLKKVIAPYPLPLPVIDIAEQALSPEGITAMRHNVAKINAARVELRSTLSQCRNVVKVFSSDANWLLVEFKDVDAVYHALKAQKIDVRSLKADPQLGNMLRISIGTPMEQKRLITVITAVDAAMKTRIL